MTDEERYGKLYAAVGIVFLAGICMGAVIGALM